MAQQSGLFERLTRTVVPTHYDLSIRTHLDTFKFHGTVIIDVQVHEPVESVTLYAAELDVTDAKLKSSSSGKKQATVLGDHLVMLELSQMSSRVPWNWTMKMNGLKSPSVVGLK